jgi:hypothetical protein
VAEAVAVAAVEDANNDYDRLAHKLAAEAAALT